MTASAKDCFLTLTDFFFVLLMPASYKASNLSAYAKLRTGAALSLRLLPSSESHPREGALVRALLVSILNDPFTHCSVAQPPDELKVLPVEMVE